MPIFMDRHIIPGVEAKHAAEAHREDLKIQHLYGCRCMTYWVDEERGSAFCLIDAPNEEAVITLHEEAHGLLPYEIIQVNSNVVEAFLGRIHDPETYSLSSGENLKVFNDPAFRVLLKTQTSNPKLLIHSLGLEKAQKLLNLYNQLVKDHLQKYEGRAVELSEPGSVVSFISVSQAIQYAMAVQKSMHLAAELIDLRIGIHAGLPVDNNDRIFGQTIKFANYLCSIGKGGQIIMSSLVHELSKEDYHRLEGNPFIVNVSSTTENFLELLMDTLHDNWQDPKFGVGKFCGAMGMSQSNLYRKCMEITGASPNGLIREYRLNKALGHLNTGRNISETSFDCGFSSPSYFTKCFKKKFAILPLAYREMLR